MNLINRISESYRSWIKDRDESRRLAALRSAYYVMEDIVESKQSIEVEDHYICYGSNVPLCGNNLGKKGLTTDKRMITCPDCKPNLKGR